MRKSKANRKPKNTVYNNIPYEMQLAKHRTVSKGLERKLFIVLYIYFISISIGTAYFYYNYTEIKALKKNYSDREKAIIDRENTVTIKETLLNNLLKINQMTGHKVIVNAIREQNFKVLAERELVLNNTALANSIIAVQQAKERIYEKYNTSDIEELKIKVLPVPEKLAISQATQESKNNNNWFGITHNGVKPMKFASMQDCTAKYLEIMNSSRALKEFRNLRANGASLNVLAMSLNKTYCEFDTYGSALINIMKTK